MSGEAIPEQRAAVMILVEASWQDADGTLQASRARMENLSNAGACIRVNTEIEIGTAIRIQSFREEFTGVVKYCRIDGKEYLVGIQRDSPSVATVKPQLRVPIPKEGSAPVPQRDSARGRGSTAPAAKIASIARGSTHPPREIPAGARKVERVTSIAVRGRSSAAKNVPAESAATSDARDSSVPIFNGPGVREVGVPSNRMASEVHVLTLVPETPAWESRDNLQYQDFDVLRWVELHTKRIHNAGTHKAVVHTAEAHKGEVPTPEVPRPEVPRPEAPRPRVWARRVGRVRERNTMQRKWLDMGGWGDKDAATENSSANKNNASDKDKTTNVTPPFAKDRPRTSAAPEDAGYQGELLPLEEIYRAAGISNPRGGYSIVKIAEMLHSEHLRGLAKDMRRASVMMALDAAGVPIHEVLRDAKTRMEAIEAYEAEQRKLCEAEWARKEEENIQIRAELERVKAQYIARINRNLEAVAREKARFTAWQTTNQQEAQNISDAAELCLKPAAAEPPSAPAPQPPAPTPTSTPSPTTSQSKAAIEVV